MSNLGEKRSAVLLIVLASACGGTGLGDAVRKDVSARMESANAPLSGCYEDALKRNRNLQGTIVLGFDTEAGTGQFTKVHAVRDDLADRQMTECVTGYLSGLKLAEPTKTVVAIQYPVHFTPRK